MRVAQETARGRQDTSRNPNENARANQLRPTLPVSESGGSSDAQRTKHTVTRAHTAAKAQEGQELRELHSTREAHKGWALQ